MYTERIYSLTKRLKNRYRTSDPFELADALNITITFKKFDKLKGMYYIVERCAFITLNEELDEVMQKIVLLHEIGHHILHRHLASTTFQEFCLYDMTSKPEMEANIFAANITLDDDDIISLARDEGYTAEQIARALYVPYPLLLIKMKDMNTRGYNFRIPYIPRADFLGRQL